MCILSISRREQLRPHKGFAMAADGGEVQSQNPKFVPNRKEIASKVDLIDSLKLRTFLNAEYLSRVKIFTFSF